jgi:Transposase zinc-ribbon domain/ISXO2-like transposase domain
MPSRWKHDRPMSRAELAQRFSDDAACARHLFQKRWPKGFVCPTCGGVKGWELSTKRFTWECAGCGRQTSVTAGTVMHRSKLPLSLWFAAIHLLSSHSNGISALQLQAQLGLRSYKTAWLLLHKLRRAMVDPERTALVDLVEVDESELPYRTKEDPPAGGQGRSHIGKLLVIGAVELSDEGKPRRIRLDRLRDFSATSITGFIDRVVAPGATIVSDGLPSYLSLKQHKHRRKVVGSMAAHVVLPWVHRKRCAATLTSGVDDGGYLVERRVSPVLPDCDAASAARYGLQMARTAITEPAICSYADARRRRFSDRDISGRRSVLAGL